MQRYSRYISSILMMMLISGMSSCISSSKIKSGAEAFDQKKYSLAIPLLETEFSAAKENSTKTKLALMLAQSYDLQNQFDKAEEWYQKYREISSDPEAAIVYAKALMRAEKYTEARDILKEHLKINKQDKFRYGVLLNTCEEVIAYLQKPDTFTKIINAAFNSPELDYGISLSRDSLFFNSTRPGANRLLNDDWMGQAYTAVYGVAIQNAAMQSQVNPSEQFGSDFHATAPSFTADGKTAYFTMCGSSSDSSDYCQIYRSRKDPVGFWSPIEKINLFADTVNNGQAFISADGGTLYFVSDVSLGYGGKDMYYSLINKEGIAGEPVNLGSKVNTSFNEMFPSVSKDGNTLYYSSDNLNSYGGLDIFTAEKNGRQFVNPKRMPYGINSGGDDFGLVIVPHDAKNDTTIIWTGYFTSNRKGGKGNDDIYFGTLKKTPPKPLLPPLFVLNGNVVEPKYEKENDPNSKVIDKIPVSRPVVLINNGRLDSDNQGLFSTQLDSNTKYTLKVSKEGYLSAEINFSTSGIAAKPGDTITLQQTIILNRIFKNVEIVLENIYYDYDKADIREDARPTLDSLVQILQQNPSIRIELASHTDCRGNDEYNMNLSQRRAESAVNYLIQKGIAADRLIAKGYGESVPVETCACEACTEAQHQRNRRTTFKILSE